MIIKNESDKTAYFHKKYNSMNDEKIMVTHILYNGI